MTNENGTQTTELQEVQVPFEVPEGFRLLTDEEAELMASNSLNPAKSNGKSKRL